MQSWQAHREGAALALPALHLHRTAKQSDELVDAGQTNAVTDLIQRVGAATVAFKDVRHFGCRNSAATVNDRALGAASG